MSTAKIRIHRERERLDSSGGDRPNGMSGMQKIESPLICAFAVNALGILCPPRSAGDQGTARASDVNSVGRFHFYSATIPSF